MTGAQFDAILNERLAAIRTVLASKGDEYARGDRLSNFKRGAAMLSRFPERVCLGFMTKHLVSVLDIVEDLERGVMASRARIDEKIGDSVNYLILLEAILRERLDGQWTEVGQ